MFKKEFILSIIRKLSFFSISIILLVSLHAVATGKDKSYMEDSAIDLSQNDVSVITAMLLNNDDFFSSLENRMLSFNYWPSANMAQIDEIAKAGFYYIKDKDIVRCFCCNVQMAEWDEDYDPWVEHARHGIECEFIIDVKGSKFVNEIKEEWKLSYAPCTPSMDYMEDRLSTFSEWSVEADPSAEKFADAGFFSKSNDYTVHCHYCSGSLCAWKEGDDPWELHAKYFPKCVFLTMFKGLDYIDKIQAEVNASKTIGATE